MKNANIIAYLADILNSFGVGCSEDSLKILLQSQRVVLMLDGFDEVKHEERTMMMNEIKTFIIILTHQLSQQRDQIQIYVILLMCIIFL